MDSRGILILVLIGCFIFQLGLISGRLIDNTEDYVYQYPQLTETQLKNLYFIGSQGTYIVLIKHVKPIEFLPRGSKPTEEKNNPIYYQGTIYVFTGLASQEIDVPKNKVNPIKKAIASVAAAISADGSQMDVAIRNPLRNPESGKEIAPGGLIYFERLRKIDYLYAGSIDMFWTIFDILTLVVPIAKSIKIESITKEIYKIIENLRSIRISSLVRTPIEKLKTLSLILRKDINKLEISQALTLYSDYKTALEEIPRVRDYLNALEQAKDFENAKKIINKIESKGILTPDEINDLKKYLDEKNQKLLREVNGKSLKDTINEIILKLDEKEEAFKQMKDTVASYIATKQLIGVKDLDEIIESSFRSITGRLPSEIERETLKKELRKAIIESGVIDKYSEWYRAIDNAFYENPQNIERALEDAFNTLPKQQDFEELYNALKNKYKEALEKEGINGEIAENIILELKERKLLETSFGEMLFKDFMVFSGAGKFSFSELKRLASMDEQKRLADLEDLYKKYLDSLEKALEKGKDYLIQEVGIRENEIDNLITQIKTIKTKRVTPDVEKKLEILSRDIENSWKIIDDYGKQLNSLNNEFATKIDNLKTLLQEENLQDNEINNIISYLQIGEFKKVDQYLKSKRIDNKEIKNALKDIKSLYNKRYKIIDNLLKEYRKAPGIWEIASIANTKLASRLNIDLSNFYKLFYILIPPYPIYKGVEKIVEKWKNFVRINNVNWKVAYGVPIIIYFAVRNTEYWLNRYFALQTIGEAYTMSYFAVLSSSNNNRLILMSNQQYYSKSTADQFRDIPLIGQWWDTLAKTCHELQVFGIVPYKTYGGLLENIRDFFHTWIINIPGFVYPTELLYHYVPYRYTIIVATGEIEFNYETGEINIHSKSSTFVSRGGEVINQQLVELSPELKLSYVYTNPIKIINAHSYRISEQGFEHLQQVIKNKFNTENIGVITYLNPAQAIAIANLKNNPKYYIEDNNQLFDIGKLLVSAAWLPNWYGLLLDSDWEIENTIISSEYGNPCKLSMIDRIKYNCIATVYNILINIEKDSKRAYEKAVNFCNNTANNEFVKSILKFMGTTGDTYYPITLDWYLYCPANYVYVKGEISGTIKMEEIGKVSDEFLKVCGWVG